MSKISELVAFAKANPSYKATKEINFSNVSKLQSDKIFASTGIEIKGFLKVLSVFAITHIIKRHGNNYLEQKFNNQIGVTDLDFEYLPEILLNPDSVTRVKDGNRGKPALLFVKTLYSQEYNVVVTLFKKRLEINTMYIK